MRPDKTRVEEILAIYILVYLGSKVRLFPTRQKLDIPGQNGPPIPGESGPVIPAQSEPLFWCF